MDSQFLALDVQRPVFDVGAIDQKATQIQTGKAQLQSANLRNQSDRLSLDAQTQESKALSAYRAASGAGDPNALDQLSKTNPEMADAIKQHLDAIGNSTQAGAIRQTTKEWEQTLTTIDGYPPGSTQQKEAWSSEIDRLVKEKFLDPQSAAAAKANPPGTLGYAQLRTHVDALIKGVASHPATIDPKIAATLWQSSLDAVGLGKLGADKIDHETDANGNDIPKEAVRQNRVKEATDIYNRALELIGGGMTPAEAVATATKAAPTTASAAPAAADPNLKHNLFGVNNGTLADAGNYLTNWATGGTNFPKAPMPAPVTPATMPDPASTSPTGIDVNNGPVENGPMKSDRQGATLQPPPDTVLQDAQAAIDAGADPDAVKQRLEDEGYDSSGITQ